MESVSANSCTLQQFNTCLKRFLWLTDLCRCKVNHFALRKIRFVANEKFVDAFCRVPVDLRQPALDILV